jgi:hypothetical protein
MAASRTPASTTPSDWPVGLLLDELWLRSRRLLVHELERLGCWSDQATYRSTMLEQARRGDELRMAVLSRVLGPAELRLLGSESIFAAANRRFRTRLPLSLAFGYELGRAFAAAAPNCDGEAMQQALELAALFNFGISTFDLLHDTMPQAASAFSACFDRDVLSRLHDGEAMETVAGAAALATDPETRILLRIIATFYAELHALTRRQQRDGAPPRPMGLLMAAYEAEMASARPDAYGPAERLRVSRSKSTLPFLIIGELARVARGGEHPAQGLLDQLAEDVGTLFWLVDDLADLVDDLRCGSINAIVLSAMKRRAGGDQASATRSVVESRAAENGVREIVRAFEAVRAAAHDPLLADTAVAGLPALVAAYVRNWIE